MPYLLQGKPWLPNTLVSNDRRHFRGEAYRRASESVSKQLLGLHRERSGGGDARGAQFGCQIIPGPPSKLPRPLSSSWWRGLVATAIVAGGVRADRFVPAI
jgi:hypothetical protein